MTRLRERDYLAAWAAFVVCATIGGMIVGFFAGAILGAIIGALHGPTQYIQIWGGVVGFFAGLPVSYGFFRLFVTKMLISRLATLPSIPSSTPESVESTTRAIG